MYADDWDGTYYYDGPQGTLVTPAPCFSQTLFSSMWELPTPPKKIRLMRACPARAGKVAGISVLGYQMPIGMYKKGLNYADANVNGSPFFGTSTYPYWPNLKSCPNPSQFVLLVETYNTSIHRRAVVYESSDQPRDEHKRRHRRPSPANRAACVGCQLSFWRWPRRIANHTVNCGNGCGPKIRQPGVHAELVGE